MLVFKKFQKGFTIVEMIIVVIVLGVLAAIVIAAINPAEQLARSRDTKRSADVEALANAIHQYVAESGSLPNGIDETERNISSSQIDLCVNLIPNYLPALPQDPLSNNGIRIKLANCSNYDTGYTVRTRGESNFVVEAPGAEVEEEIAEVR